MRYRAWGWLRQNGGFDMRLYLFLQNGSPQHVWGAADTDTDKWTFSASLEWGGRAVSTRKHVNSLFRLARKRALAGWLQILPYLKIHDDKLAGPGSFDEAKLIYQGVIQELRWAGLIHSRENAQQIAIDCLRKQQLRITCGEFFDNALNEAGVFDPATLQPGYNPLPSIAPQAPWAF